MSQSEHMVLLNNLKYAFGRIVRYSHRLVLLPEDPSFYEEIAQWVNQTQAKHRNEQDKSNATAGSGTRK